MIEKTVGIICNLHNPLKILWQVLYVDDWLVLCQFVCLQHARLEKIT